VPRYLNDKTARNEALRAVVESSDLQPGGE